MIKSRWSVLFLPFLSGILLLGVWLVALKAQSAAAQKPAAAVENEYVLLSWNDLGMHCYNADFADLAVLPPFNTLWAQVVRRGDPPTIVTAGIRVTYVFTDNTTSLGKTNFWDYAQDLFDLAAPLPPDIGLTGKGLSGEMDLTGDHFEAVGIPLTEFSDSAPTTTDPYQLATVTVWNYNNNQMLAQARVVAPVSSEMRCDLCHSDTGSATVESGITPTGKVETNILTMHDQENLDDYPPGYELPLMEQRPVLCATCHSSNALGAPGLDDLPSLSNAMHEKHAEEGDDFPAGTEGCYQCHPGPDTLCLRDVMSQEYDFTCNDCHGDMLAVAQNPDPWLNEPRCDTCHGVATQQDQPLYRNSIGHGAVFCEACHDSTHAIAESREPRDGLKFVDLQGHAGTLNTCTVCHLTQPAGTFQHDIEPKTNFEFLPLTVR